MPLPWETYQARLRGGDSLLQLRCNLERSERHDRLDAAELDRERGATQHDAAQHLAMPCNTLQHLTTRRATRSAARLNLPDRSLQFYRKQRKQRGGGGGAFPTFKSGGDRARGVAGLRIE
jgi:hypothetical protein